MVNKKFREELAQKWDTPFDGEIVGADAKRGVVAELAEDSPSGLVARALDEERVHREEAAQRDAHRRADARRLDLLVAAGAARAREALRDRRDARTARTMATAAGGRALLSGQRGGGATQRAERHQTVRDTLLY